MSEQLPEMTPKRTVVVLPTYNEAANLPEMIGRLFALNVPGLMVLIVDDNSPDGTGKVADELALQFHSQVRVLHRERKEGLGRAYLSGFERAMELGAEYIIQMDADFSHPATAIPEMLLAIPNCDVVVGSRYVSGGLLDEHWGWWRRFLSWWANEVWSRRILNVHARDITAGFKCWRRETLLGIGLDRVVSNGYAFQVEMSFLCERLGYRTCEIPIYFEDRRVGKSKMSNRVKLQGALDVLRVRLRQRGIQRRPPTSWAKPRADA
jgi:dolichol-phosphate mannosyltransferase